jgi:hypothetical protein
MAAQRAAYYFRLARKLVHAARSRTQTRSQMGLTLRLPSGVVPIQHSVSAHLTKSITTTKSYSNNQYGNRRALI